MVMNNDQGPVVLTTPRRRKRLQRQEEMRISFNHGLGDALMFRAALSHVKQHVDLVVHPGTKYAQFFEGMDNVTVRESRRQTRGRYEIRFYPEDSDRQCVSGAKTKTRICMEHELGVFDPDIVVKPHPLNWANKTTADVWRSLYAISRKGPKRYLVFHGQAGSSPERKDCPPWLAWHIQEVVESMGFRLIVLNYDFTHRIKSRPDYWWVGVNDSLSTKGYPTGALPMWHILNQASEFIGVDSGPLHLALTIPRLPCVFIRNQIDFMTQFYDAGLDQIKSILSYESSFPEVTEAIKNLP